ncbi:hypothetical protein ABPG75_003483 [Micractinium tetrahymenae]
MEPSCKADVALDIGASPGPSTPPPPCSPGTEARAHALLGAHQVWIGLSSSSKALLGISGAHALAAAVCGCSLFWQGASWLDAALILATAVLSLALLADAFVRENAYQLLASLAVSCLLGGSQLGVLLATAERNAVATAAGAACLALQAGAAVLARPAYRSFGWRMYSRIAANWRLRPSEQQRQRARQLSKQLFAALAKLDALLLALLLVVASIGAANPASGTAAAQPHPVGLLIGAAAAAAALLPAWLAACAAAAVAPSALQGQRRRWQLAVTVDLLYPLCYVPPLLAIFAGASKGGQLAQPHAEAYLILYPILFLAARTATWQASRQLLSCCPQHNTEASSGSRPGALGGSSSAAAEVWEPALPPELLPLLRGAWIQKLPSVSAAATAALEAAATAAVAAAAAAEKSSDSLLTCCGGGACSECADARAAAGCGGGCRAPQRFFQLSADGAALRWSWDRWILMPHVQAINCCDESLTIRLALLLEPDLRLRFPVRQQYQDWAAALRLLLALLLQPDDPPQRRPSTACSLGRSSGAAGSGRRSSSSMGKEVVLQITGGTACTAGPAAGPGAGQETRPASVAAGAGGEPTHGCGLPQEASFVRRALTINTGRVCARSDSQQHLEAAMARSQAALAGTAAAPAASCAMQRQPSGDGEGQKQQQQAEGSGLRRTATISLVAIASLPSMPDLAAQPSLKVTSSEGALELISSGRHQLGPPPVQPRRGPWQRLRSGLRQLWRAGSGGAAGGSSSAGAKGSPSRQPLRSGGTLQPSSSSGDLLVAANQQSQASEEQPAMQEQQQQQDPEEPDRQAEGAAKRHERVPTLQLWAEAPQPQQPQQLVPPLNLGQLAGSSATGGGKAGDTVHSQEPGPPSLAPAQAQEHAGGSAAAAQARPTPRLLLQGPFIHLQVAFAGPSGATHPGDPAPQPSSSSARGAEQQEGLAQGPSIAGSEASTPAHPSAAGSPLRGSPSRQQQLQRFSLYLQQQLALQQQGRFGGGSQGDSSSGVGSGVGSGSQSPAGSPPVASPGRKESDASLVAWTDTGGGEAAPGEPGGGSSSTTAAAAAHAATVGASALALDPPVVPGGLRSAGASRLSQQQFTARLAGASAGTCPAGDDPAVSGRSSLDGGSSAPPSGLPGWPGGASSGPLVRAESTFSSWGLPTPTTAKTTPFTGLSRFNSLVPSLAQTPLATFRQHPAFAAGLPQPSLHAHPALLAGPAVGAGTGWLGGMPAGSAAGQWQQRSGRRHGSFSAAGGEGRRRSAEGAGGAERREEEEEEEDASPGTAGSSERTSPMSVVAGLGISVPVEMVQFSDLVFGKLLGEGSEGAVYAAWYRETPVAVKRTRSLMELEMNLHAGSHDNIVQLRGLCSHGPDLYLVMELCPRGTLDVLIHKGHLQHPGGGTAAVLGAGGPGGHRLDPLKLLPIVRSMARGMLHLHTRRPAILHRDLKPGNLFLGHGGVVKVGDFGMSRYAESWRREEVEGALERTLTPGVIGTAAYSAPELLNPDTPTDSRRPPGPEDEQRILKADVYAFGVTLYEILERKRPFAGMDGFQIQTQWYLNPESMRLPAPTIPEGVTPAARQILETLAGLVAACTRWDPDARPTFNDILATLRTCSVPGGGPAAGAGASVPGASEAAPSPPTPAGALAAPLMVAVLSRRLPPLPSGRAAPKAVLPGAPAPAPPLLRAAGAPACLARRLHYHPAAQQKTEDLSKQPRDNEEAKTTTVAAPADNPLFWPFVMGPFELAHRLVMAPLTRCRAIDSIPRSNAVEYYSQRASDGGLIISEATCISDTAHGYPHTPGIYSREQLDGWRPVVEAVRAKGAHFFSQLWHVGRASHNDFQPGGQAPISASAIPITDGTQVFSLSQGKMVDFPTPRALEVHEIPGIVEQYRRAARNAIDVGFSGVEIHGANGYLIDQFLKSECNHRTDEYGGSIETRCRFALEVVDAVCDEVGANRVGIRLSMFGGFQNATDEHPYALGSFLLEELNKRGLCYVHMVEPRAANQAIRETQDSLEPFCKVWRGPMIAAGGYKRESAMHAVQSGHADLVAIGREFITNPDLPLRFCLDAPLNPYHRATFYTQGDEGYIDYPLLRDTEYAEEFFGKHPCALNEP